MSSTKRHGVQDRGYVGHGTHTQKIVSWRGSSSCQAEDARMTDQRVALLGRLCHQSLLAIATIRLPIYWCDLQAETLRADRCSSSKHFSCVIVQTTC